MSYKEIVLNYIKTHDVPCLLRGDIEDGLRKCKSDDDVHELIFRINYRLTVNNCAVRGYKNDYILLVFSFTGWIILGAFTFGILYLWLFPYMSVTLANFYDEIKK